MTAEPACVSKALELVIARHGSILRVADRGPGRGGDRAADAADAAVPHRDVHDTGVRRLAAGGRVVSDRVMHIDLKLRAGCVACRFDVARTWSAANLRAP